MWNREGTCACITESLCCTPETVTISLISYTPRNKKIKPEIVEEWWASEIVEEWFTWRMFQKILNLIFTLWKLENYILH